jgi:hypothetical protein
MPAVLRDGGLRGPGATSPLAGALWWFKGGKDVGSSSLLVIQARRSKIATGE